MKKDTFYFPVFFSFCLVVSIMAPSCNTSTGGDTNSDPIGENEMVGDEDNDTKEVKRLLNKFFEEYKDYTIIKEFTDYEGDKSAYSREYFNFLEGKANTSFSHLSTTFLKQLKTTLEACNKDKDPKATSCEEPIFECPGGFGDIEIIGVDADEKEAVAHVLVYLGEGSLKTVFYLVKNRGKWMITSRENLGKVEQPNDPDEILKYVGYYASKDDFGSQYKIYRKKDKMVLEHCEKGKCIERGNIEGLEVRKNTAYLKVEGISGEMVPRWHFSEGILHVHDYDAENDIWFDAVYVPEDAAG